MFPHQFISDSENPHIINGPETLHNFPEYIEKYKNVFVKDSIDFFFLFTYYKIRDGSIDLHGMS